MLALPLVLALLQSHDVGPKIDVNHVRGFALSPTNELWAGSIDGHLYVSRGACVRVRNGYASSTEIQVWRNGAFEAIRTFEHGESDARVDAQGCLLVRLEDSEVWCLSADASQWSRLANIECPAR